MNVRTLIVLCVALLSGLRLSSASAELINVGAAELEQLLAEDKVTLIDVRTAPEWQETGVVEGSVLLTFFDERGRYDAAAWLKAMAEYASPEKPVALICRTGSRTGTISRFLDKQVGLKVYNATGGVTAWQRSGRELVPAQSISAQDNRQ